MMFLVMNDINIFTGLMIYSYHFNNPIYNLIIQYNQYIINNYFLNINFNLFIIKYMIGQFILAIKKLTL